MNKRNPLTVCFHIILCNCSVFITFPARQKETCQPVFAVDLGKVFGPEQDLDYANEVSVPAVRHQPK